MLDRAIVLAGFTIRRMFEKKLVTDKLAQEEMLFRTFPSKRSRRFRTPYVGHTGGWAFQNYNFKKTQTKRLRIGDLANEIIHASQLMFVKDEDAIKTGLLIASDWHLRDRVLHLTIEEFTNAASRVLEDEVNFTSDRWNPETGKVDAIRE